MNEAADRSNYQNNTNNIVMPRKQSQQRMNEKLPHRVLLPGANHVTQTKVLINSLNQLIVPKHIFPGTHTHSRESYSERELPHVAGT